MHMQGARYSIPYFVNPKLNYIIQGPEKRFSPVTGFDLLSKTGNAYVARKNGARLQTVPQLQTACMQLGTPKEAFDHSSCGAWTV
jgi:hypothetical protein